MSRNYTVKQLLTPNRIGARHFTREGGEALYMQPKALQGTDRQLECLHLLRLYNDFAPLKSTPEQEWCGDCGRLFQTPESCTHGLCYRVESVALGEPPEPLKCWYCELEIESSDEPSA